MYTPVHGYIHVHYEFLDKDCVWLTAGTMCTSMAQTQLLFKSRPLFEPGVYSDKYS